MPTKVRARSNENIVVRGCNFVGVECQPPMSSEQVAALANAATAATAVAVAVQKIADALRGQEIVNNGVGLSFNSSDAK